MQKNRLTVVWELLWFCVLCAVSAIAAEPPKAAVFLIQDVWGGIIGLSLRSDGILSEPELVRPMMGTQAFPVFIDLRVDATGGYQLTLFGAIVPIGGAKLAFFYWTPMGEAKSFALVPGGVGGWIASENYITSLGRPPQLVFPPFHRTIMDLEYNAPEQKLTVLQEDGTIALCRRLMYEILDRLQLKEEKAIDVEEGPDAFYVLTQGANIYRVTADQADPVPNPPKVKPGTARSLKRSPFGKGFYLLDAFGVIHAWGGAPAVPNEPMSVEAAVALEIIPTDTIPHWYPSGWNTEAALTPREITLDPEAPPKNLSLMIQGAENLSGFSAEIRYDPKVLTMAPDKIEVGEWWGKNVREAQVAASSEKGLIGLQGGGAFFPYNGATGNGELAKIPVASVKGIDRATTTLEISNFYFRDASPGNLYQPGRIVDAATIFIRPSQPRLKLAWRIEGATHSTKELVVKPGAIVQADLLAEEGSRISEIEFGFRFSSNLLKFLGMSPGDAWRKDSFHQPIFSIPSLINREGGAENQSIKAETAGACEDELGAIVSYFFTVTARGEGTMMAQSIRIRDGANQELDFRLDNSELSFASR